MDAASIVSGNVWESKSEQCEAQVNLTDATEDPNQVSEEPKASYAQEGKPWSMTYYF